MPFLSYAQNFEDVLLWRALGDCVSGFYVDVGAADPDEDSVTRAFYDRGWRGINIEPVPELAARITAARPRDINLAVAVGAELGETTLHLVQDSGLSTTDASIAEEIARRGFPSRAVTVPLRTLTSILEEHAPPVIHFLKVDVEGAERAVLSGCDFGLFRPWIVLVEATAPMSNVPTHVAWEGLLTSARYRPVFFDGLNRYYVAEEHADALSLHFTAPVNVFDDFRRALDLRADWADGHAAAKATAARAAVAEDSARAAYARAFEVARDLAEARHATAKRITELDGHISGLTAHAAHMEARADAAERALTEASHLVAALRASTSWRVSAPVRTAGNLARRLRLIRPLTGDVRAGGLDVEGSPAASAQAEKPSATAEPVTPSPARPEAMPHQGRNQPRVATRPVRAVHQFHSGSAVGDAITNAMLLLRGILRKLGYRSEIYVEHRDAGLADELRLLEEMPWHDDHVLILHHSMGHDALDRVLASAAPKVLLFHNITPPEFLADSPFLQRYARRGRDQLATIRTHVAAALADSEYNAGELRALGYAPVRAATLLFDLEALERRAAAHQRLPGDRPFTVLFTGRVTEAKGQLEVVEAYARFRAGMDRPCQLVLVGRTDVEGTYIAALDAAMRRSGLEAELVFTGLVSDEELHARFAEADLFLSLSRHEGFGVPLVEAVVHGVPVLAWPAGAVPYTLGGHGLLEGRDPDGVAARMLEIARDPDRRAALIAAQRAAIGRFALSRQLPALQETLALAGAVPPAGEVAREAMRPNLRYTVAGHTAGTYSLAAVNRDLACALEAERPGHVRLRPVEGTPTDDLSGVPAAARGRIAPLAGRGPPETGPEVIISQHYPVHVPDAPGGLPLAMLFWEESLLPAATIAVLGEGFRAVLAPTAFVARALVASGLPIPVRVVGHAPDLSAMAAIGRERGLAAARPADRTVTFLHVSSLFPRKGADVLLAAFVRAFQRGDPVRLVIKGFPNPHNTVAADLAALRAADPDLPEIELVDRDLPEEELLAIYRAADAMVLPTRGEGFNLPAAEAMAAGIPLIVTGGGGHMDFLDAGTARLLRWRHAPSGSHLATPGSLWMEPDSDDLVAALRETVEALQAPEGRAALAERARRARLRVARDLRAAPVVRRIEETALDLLLAPPPPPLRVAWVTSWEVRCGVAEYARQLLRAMPDHPGIAAHTILPDTRWTDGDCGPGTRRHAVRPAWRLGDPAAAVTLAAALGAEDPHVVVIQHQPGLVGWEALAALLAAPALRDRVVIVTLHNTRHLLETAAAGDPVVAALGRADRVLVHAVADLERLRTVGLSDNVALMPHGVKAPLDGPAGPDPAGPPLIGSYGFLLPDKGIPELVAAFALLRRDWPGARLRLVNADYGTQASAEEIARARAAARDAGVEDAIEWHTAFLPEEESLSLLAACTLVVLPTQMSKESSSASMRDAMATGRPVLVTPLPIFDEAGDAVLRAGGTDPRALASAMDAALRDAAAQETARGAARTWLAERSWDVVARRLQGLMLGLAAGHRLPRRTGPGDGPGAITET